MSAGDEDVRFLLSYKGTQHIIEEVVGELTAHQTGFEGVLVCFILFHECFPTQGLKRKNQRQQCFALETDLFSFTQGFHLPSTLHGNEFKYYF